MLNKNLLLLSEVFEMSDISYESTGNTYHALRHSYKPQVLVPIVAITHNIDFIFNRCGTRYVTTADNIKCIVESSEEKHICECEDLIRQLYNCDPWAYLKRWHKAIPNMQSMEFMLISLKKIENE